MCVQKEGEFFVILRLHGEGDSRLMVVIPRCCKTLYMDVNGIQNDGLYYDVLLACSSKLSMNVQVRNFSEGLKDRLGGHYALCWLNDLIPCI